MILQSLAGLPAFPVYFCTGIVAVVAYLFVYTRVTPHDEFKLIRDNQRRFLIKPIFVGHFFRILLAQRHARWVRLVCARLLGAFFRRRLMAKDI